MKSARLLLRPSLEARRPKCELKATHSATSLGKSTATLTMAKPSNSPAPLSTQALGYMFLLALQFGIQPILTRRFTPPDISRTTVIIMQETVKFFLAGFMLTSSGSLRSALAGWSLYGWITVACVPAALYTVQNLAALVAYQNLDAMTFNVLNQTKTLSAALCCYLIIGRKQSRVQIAALFLLLLSALVIERIVTLDTLLSLFGSIASVETSEKGTKMSATHSTYGVLPVLLASFISGLAGAITQKNLQGVSGSGKSESKNAVLFSAELCVASLILLGASLMVNEDGKRIAEKGFFDKWTIHTFIPIFTNAAGGIVVGLVTKYAGSVRKGFALIFGMLLSGAIQASLDEHGEGKAAISNEEILGGCLAAISLYMHTTNPYVLHLQKESKPPISGSVGVSKKGWKSTYRRTAISLS